MQLPAHPTPCLASCTLQLSETCMNKLMDKFMNDNSDVGRLAIEFFEECDAAVRGETGAPVPAPAPAPLPAAADEEEPAAAPASGALVPALSASKPRSSFVDCCPSRRPPAVHFAVNHTGGSVGFPHSCSLHAVCRRKRGGPAQLVHPHAGVCCSKCAAHRTAVHAVHCSCRVHCAGVSGHSHFTAL